MPAAAIGAGAAVAGGIASGKGASKAAKIQAQSQREQIARLEAMYNTNKELMTPTFENGAAAQSRINTMLGLPGGDGSDPTAVLASTPGYQFAQNQAMNAVNANAYARGAGNSGAAIKALQDRAGNIASQNYNNYMSQVGGVADRGVGAMNGLVSQGNYSTGAINTVSQTSADNQAANAVFQGQNISNTLKAVAGSAGEAFGSSYSTPNLSPGAGMTGATPGYGGGVQGLFDPRAFASKYGVGG